MPPTQQSPLLSENGHKIVNILLEQAGTWLTTAKLAESISVSRRTVLRELSSVEQWLSHNGAALTRSPGLGIQLTAEPEELQRLAQELHSKKPTLTKKERTQRLMAMLFRSQEPIKAYVMARELDISERTLKVELDQLEAELLPHDVQLCRRPGVGTWISGTPEARRRAIGSMFRAELPSEDIRQILLGNFPTGSILSEILDADIAEGVLSVLRRFDSEEAFGFTDSGYLTLAIHLILTIQTLRNSATQTPSAMNGFSAPTRRLAAALEKKFVLSFPDEERAYLEHYLKANRPDRERQGWDNADEWNLRHLASQLISAMEAIMDLEFSRYPALLNDLCCHLRSVLYRAEQGRRIDNPSVELIKAQYPALWEATRSSCDMLAETGVLPALNDEEAAFLAMHFGAIIERENLLRLKVHAVVVCPYGMASCRFLISQLQKEFPTLQISRCASVRDISLEELEQNQADLVISTIPLELDFPCVVVSTILTAQDKELIHTAMAQIKNKPSRPQKRLHSEDWKGLYYTGKLSASIDELLDTLMIDQILAPASRSTLITRASHLFCPLDYDAKQVEAGLLRREALADTYVKPLRSVLLHCKTNAVSGCRFGYLESVPPVYENGKIICGALVLLIPDDGDKARLEIMQSVSSLLVEDDRLITALRNNNRPEAVRLLREGLAQRVAMD